MENQPLFVNNQQKKKTAVRNYFGITFGYTWLFWFIVVFSKQDAYSLPNLALFYAGGIGPTIGALFVIFADYSKEERKNYLRRLFDPRLIGIKWGIIIFLIVITITFCAVGLDILISGKYSLVNIPKLNGNIFGLIWLFFYLFLFGPFPEELGWRGIGNYELNKKFNFVVSGIIVGLFWSIWHLPLFFMKNTYQQELGFGSLSSILFFLQPVITSVIIGWIFEKTHRSTLSAMIFHYLNNLLGQILEPRLQAEFFRTIGFFIIMIFIILGNSNKSLEKSE